MTDTRSNGGGSPSPAWCEGRRAIATSLFGGAMQAPAEKPLLPLREKVARSAG